MECMSHRKLRETKQQPSMLPCPAVSGCCLVSFCFLCDIHSIHSVKDDYTMSYDSTHKFKSTKACCRPELSPCRPEAGRPRQEDPGVVPPRRGRRHKGEPRPRRPRRETPFGGASDAGLPHEAPQEAGNEEEPAGAQD